MIKKVDHIIVPIGGWCQVAEQLKRHNIEYNKNHFEWLVTPFDSLIEIILDSGQRLSVSVSDYDHGASIICNEYGVLYHHDFPRDTYGKVVLTEETRENVRSKLLHKASCFSQVCLNSKKKIFLRLGGANGPLGAWPYAKEKADFPVSQLVRLSRAIGETYPDIDFILAFVYYIGKTNIVYDTDLPEYIKIFGMMMPPEPLNWAGNDRQWTEIFEKLGFAKA